MTAKRYAVWSKMEWTPELQFAHEVVLAADYEAALARIQHLEKMLAAMQDHVSVTTVIPEAE